MYHVLMNMQIWISKNIKQWKKYIYLKQLPLELVASNATYSIFLDLMERSGFLETYSTPMSLPVTVFMPTDQAFRELYPDKLTELQDPANIEKLREYLGYHIISHRKVKRQQYCSKFCTHRQHSIVW